MPVTNPEAIAFCNQRVRPIADMLAQAYFAAKAVQVAWNAGNYGNTTLQGNQGVVRDTASPTDDSGTGGDGRPVITAGEVVNVITRVNEFVADYEAGTNAKLNTIMAVAVNPTRNS